MFCVFQERIVACCLEKGIAIYSPHTSYDTLEGGVNDWLIQAFDGTNVIPLQPSLQAPRYSHQVVIRHNQGGKVEEILENSYVLEILNKTGISYVNADESRTVLCQEKDLPSILSISSHQPLQFTITKLEQTPIPGHGTGRKCDLKSPITIREAVNKVKCHLKLPYIRLALAHNTNEDSPINSLAVCAGSGSSVLRGTKVDLWLTGEMSHHEVLDATHSGTSVILTDHSNSERGFLLQLKPRLVELLKGKVQVIVSEKDRDPLQVI
ncbi:NGG1 interacting factor [Halocaridina rubra]|uniref:NIF3-like protein 1 n=1 Tax=Halocaridina rubra TaxID=373956 RepID=A0AAN8X4P4_HALRR